MQTRARDLSPGECHVRHVECYGVNFDVLMRCEKDKISGRVVIVGPAAYEHWVEPDSPRIETEGVTFTPRVAPDLTRRRLG
jgi:hypothetical protein